MPLFAANLLLRAMYPVTYGAPVSGTGVSFVGRAFSTGLSADIANGLVVDISGLGIAANDVALGFYATGNTVDNNNDAQITGGAAFTEIADLYRDDSDDANLYAGYYVLAGTESSVTFNTDQAVSLGSGSVAEVLIFRGVDTTTPLDVTPTTANSINTILANPPSITPVTSGAWIVACGASSHLQGVGVTYSSPDLLGFVSTNTGTDESRDVIMGIGYEEAANLTDPAAFTFSGTDNIRSAWVAVTIALRPSGGINPDTRVNYATVTHDGDFNPTDVANFWGFAWTPDGNTLVVSTSAGDMRAYAVPTAFDITSIVTTTASANCAVGSGTYGFDFDNNGNIVASDLGQTPKLVSFSTPYDLSTFTGTSVMSTLSTSTQATSEFADNGNYWLTATFQGPAVLHSLSTPYDLSTAGTTTTLDGNTQDTEETGYSISPNGKQVIMVGRQNDYAHFYTLGTNWDLSTATYDGQMPLLLDTSQPNTVHWSPDMTKFWITGSAVHHIRQYSLEFI